MDCFQNAALKAQAFFFHLELRKSQARAASTEGPCSEP